MDMHQVIKNNIKTRNKMSLIIKSYELCLNMLYLNSPIDRYIESKLLLLISLMYQCNYFEVDDYIYVRIKNKYRILLKIDSEIKKGKTISKTNLRKLRSVCEKYLFFSVEIRRAIQEEEKRRKE